MKAKNTLYFFDDYHINTKKTTAEYRLHHPRRCECVLTHDAPWEGSGCTYHNYFYDSDLGVYRMYYLGMNYTHEAPIKSIVVCYAESLDGLNWKKPNLGICEWAGSKNNNIILGSEVDCIGNFMVFKDTNPACLPNEKYKAICSFDPVRGIDTLWSFVSPDGLHFERKEIITTEGKFDSLNLAFWCEKTKKYLCYFRDERAGHRDVRYIESFDFHTWSEAVFLDYGEDAEEMEIYTNLVQPYGDGLEPLYIGFPTRYVERVWSSTMEQLPNLEERSKRRDKEVRFGTAVTDALFMCSRDGKKFRRYDEAFLRPGPERNTNWVYGDCYPARGFIETKSAIEGEENELSMYVSENHCVAPKKLRRYTIRKDGFVSLHAGESEKTIVTKPVVLSSSIIKANMSTSAWGYVYCTIVFACGTRVDSKESFGDNTCRYFDFGGVDFSEYLGREAVLEFRLRDADIYSVSFMEENDKQ